MSQSRQDTLIRQLQNALGVRGHVNSNGTIRTGTGFSVVRNGAGDYTVTLDKPFTSDLIPDLTAGFTAGAIAVKLFSTAPTVDSFRVITYTSTTGSAIDCDFTFRAAP